jgi:hypothetical protein
MNGEIKVVTVRSSLMPRWYRHPILWWKLRHLRADLRRPRTEIERRLDEEIDRAFLFGDDER